MYFRLLIAVAAASLTGSAAAQVSTSLDGVYMGLRQNAVTGAMYQDYWTFVPDGRVIDMYPDEGLSRPLDFDRFCQSFVCGTYVRLDHVVQIWWGSAAEAKVYDLDAEGALLERGRVQKYRPLLPLDGLRLDATYSVDDLENGFTMVELQLTAEGRFREINLMGYTQWELLAPPGETRQALPGGEGTYTIHRNTLTLQYDGGPTAYFFVVVPPGEVDRPVPNALYVNTARLHRRTSTSAETIPLVAPALALSAPVPNPIGASTHLSLTVSSPQHVRVEVFDALGRRVAVLPTIQAEAGRMEDLHLNTHALPAGRYFVRATGEAATATQALTVAR